MQTKTKGAFKNLIFLKDEVHSIRGIA